MLILLPALALAALLIREILSEERRLTRMARDCERRGAGC